MAKYTVTMSCGHAEIVELIGKNTEREKKIEYFEKHGLCKECYKKDIREREAAQGLVFSATVMPIIDEEDGSLLVNVYYSGDTMTHKDDFKEAGYHWSECCSAQSAFSAKRPPLYWNKTIKLSELSDEVAKAMSIGASSSVVENNLFASVHYRIALDKQKEWQLKKERINAIKKPEVPAIIADKQWNQKVYGKAGNYSIYLDGEKNVITDEMADEIKDYLEKKEVYEAEIKSL